MKKLMSIFIIFLLLCPLRGGNTMAITNSMDYSQMIKDKQAANPNLSYTDIAPELAARNIKMSLNPNASSVSNDDLLKSLGIAKPVGPDPGQGVDFNTNVMKNYDQSLLNFQNDVRTNNNGVYDSAKFSQYNPNGTLPAAQVPTTATAAPQFDMQAAIRDMQAARLASRAAALGKSRDSGLAMLDTQQAGVEPAYYGKRNEVAAASDLGQMNFAQFQAARGIKGNAAAMPEIYKNNALQSNIGKLNAQEQGQFDTINNNRTQLQNNYQSDLSAAQADIEAQAMQAQIDQMNADRGYNLDLGNATGTINGVSTIAAQQLAAQNAQNAIQNNQWNTTNSQAMDQQTWANQFQKDQAVTQQSQYDTTLAFNASRNQVLDGQWMKNYSLDQQKMIADKAYNDKKLTQDDYANVTSRINANASAANGVTQNAISQQNANTAAANATNNQNEAIAVAKVKVYNDAISAIDNSPYITKNASLGTTKVESPVALKSYIISLNLPDDDTDKLLSRYGLPINK